MNIQELPDNRLYWPPLTIRCIECRSFGRELLVGVTTVDRLADYEWKDETTVDVIQPLPTIELPLTDAGEKTRCIRLIVFQFHTVILAFH